MDLKSIAEYISKDSERYASLTIRRIRDVVVLLEKNPRIGRMVPEIGKDDHFREVILGYYRIIYKITSPALVHILTIHHSSKRLRQTSFIHIK